jgi:Endoplasmic Reticulum Oxidoreductin 1 (ERO1)
MRLMIAVQGEHAHRIWDAIYSQTCFRDVYSAVCDEESLVFYRIISGLHASISMHLLHDYPQVGQLAEWGPNMAIFKERMVPAERCGHVSNLYFAYLFVLEAVARAAPALREVHYVTGMAEEDAVTQVCTWSSVHHNALQKMCMSCPSSQDYKQNSSFQRYCVFLGAFWVLVVGRDLRGQLCGGLSMFCHVYRSSWRASCPVLNC